MATGNSYRGSFNAGVTAGGGDCPQIGSDRLADRQRLDRYVAACSLDCERNVLFAEMDDPFAYAEVHRGGC